MSEYLRKYIKKDHYPVHFSQLKFKTYFNNCISSALLGRDYKQTDADDWDIYWVEKHLVTESLDAIRLHPDKRVNHFRNYYEICRKDLLAKNIKKHKKALQKQGKTEEALAYNFAPLTYNLPSEFSIFSEEYKRLKDRQKPIWIMKPIALSQGKGIFLFKSISDIEQWSDLKNQPEQYIVQRYIHNPLLIGNKKFDLRIYVLVTSHNNLTIYLYRSGFGRFTHCRYDCVDLNHLEGHLTNVAVQKNSSNYDDELGGKYLLDKLKIYMLSKYGQQSTNQCFYQIQELIIRTLESTSKIIITDKRCFELYGFDVLIDSTLKPWLMEVNGSPSMTANTPTDNALKIGLLDDTLTIVNLQRLLTGDEEQVGGFDLIYKNKRIKSSIKEFSMLGTMNNRMQNMRRMAKLVALKLGEKPKQSQKDNRNKSTFNNAVKRTNFGSIIKKTIVNDTNKLTDANKVKLPKVVAANSNKLIDTNIKKPSELFRITQSKQSKR